MKPDPQAAKWEADPLDWGAGHADKLRVALDVRQKRQRRRRIATGGGAVVLLLMGVLWFMPRVATDAIPVPSGRAIVTAPEKRTLPDGSVVELKPGAELAVSFTATSAGPRSVALTKGEALFTVAKNPDRPFVVTAGGVRFRAVGTAFAVDLRTSSVGMLVTEGRVAVETTTSDSGPLETVATVDVGQSVEIPLAPNPMTTVVTETAAESAQKLAWRVPRLEFNDTPLWEVVSLLNQHSGARISLASAELGRVEISGALRADNLEPLFQTLEDNYKIKIVRRPGGEIELRAAQP